MAAFEEGYNRAATGVRLGNALSLALKSTGTARGEGWESSEIVVRMSGVLPSRLCVQCRADGNFGVNIAHRYWLGKLPGLRRMASSSGAQVDFWDNNGDTLCFKRFHCRRTGDLFRSILTGSRARRALEGGELARRSGFAAPDAYCVMEERRCRLICCASALVTRKVDAPRLFELLEKGKLGLIPRDDRRRLLTSLGREVGSLHAAGLCHGDMRAGNILCGGDIGSPEFVWLDNERTGRCESIRGRAANLAQLNMVSPDLVSRTDRLRVWKAYTAALKPGPAVKERLLSEVLRISERRWKKRGWLDGYRKRQRRESA